MHRTAVFVLLWLSVAIATPSAFAARYASIIIEPSTGRVFHAANPDSRAYPASLTKMMTLYMMFEALESGKLGLNQKLKVSRVAAGRSPSKLGLRRGQTISVSDIIGALVTKSANDAATVIAEALGGTEARFARLMTKKARKLSMARTTFRNASGLPHRRQVTTARDIATLAKALARDFPNHYHNFSRKSFEYKGRKYRNHNRLLKRVKGVDGIKTGYTRASGFNLAVSAKRDKHRLIGVVFGGKSRRWRDAHMTRLLNQAFNTLNDVETPQIAKKKRKVRKRRAHARKKVKKRKRRKRIAKRRTRRPEGWAVQVGAYDRYNPAHLAATRAARAIPVLLRSRISIVPTRSRRRPVYRARLVVNNEATARNACRLLKQKKFDCIVIKSWVTVAEGDG